MTTTAPGSRLLRSSGVVGLGTALSRVSGLVRVLAITHAFGASNLSDAYNLANTTPNVLYELILGGVLSATLVPVLVSSLDRDDDGASAIISVATTGLVLLTTAAVFAAPWIMRLYTLRRSQEEADALAAVGVPLMRLFLIQILFYGLTTLGTSLLNAHGRFAVPAFAPVLNNLVVSAALLLFPVVAGGHPDLAAVRADPKLIWYLGLATTGGIIAMTVVLWPAVRATGTRLRWRFDLAHPAVRTVARLSGWTAGYVAANQVALIVVSTLANQREGDVSAYTYAFVFFQLPHGLFAVSLMTTFVPALARSASAGDRAGFERRFAFGLRALGVGIFPAAAGYVAIGRPLVALLQWGEFDASDVAVTADVLQLFALGLAGFSLYLFTLRGFYALQDTKTPFQLNVLENGLNVVLAIALVGPLGVQGLALAYALAYTAAAAVSLVVLRRRIGGLGGRLTGRSLGTTAAAAAVMGVAVAFLTRSVGGLEGWEAVVRLTVGVGLGAVLYVGLLLLTGTRPSGTPHP